MGQREEQQAGVYRPGVCNIGPAEIRLRWLVGHVAAVATLGLMVLLIALHAPPIARLLVALPAAGAAFSYLEAHTRFCGSFGLLGVYNFGRLGSRQRVSDPAARARDRRQALSMTVASLTAGAAVGIVALSLPI